MTISAEGIYGRAEQVLHVESCPGQPVTIAFDTSDPHQAIITIAIERRSDGPPFSLCSGRSGEETDEEEPPGASAGGR